MSTKTFKNLILSTGTILGSFIFALNANAVCPVCTIAVASCLGLSRWLGIDDTISGVWIGGLTASMVMWTIDWLDRKNVRFKGRKLSVLFGYYIIIFVPLYFTNVIGYPYNRILGIDKLIFGVIFGSIFFYAGAKFYVYLKHKNNNHAYFPFQKVVMPITPLVILSIIFYFLTCK
jgi:hypothetical protein